MKLEAECEGEAPRERLRHGWLALSRVKPPWTLVVGAVFVLVLLVLVISAVVNWIAGWDIENWPLVLLTATPIRLWFAGHSAGLPLSPDALWVMWIVCGVAFFVFALARTCGGRVGWALYGALTISAVHAGTAPPSQWTAAGVAAMTWAVLSIPAYSGRPNPPPPTSLDTARPAAEAESDERSFPDEPAVLAEILAVMLRRRAQRARHAAPTAAASWTVNGGQGHGFRAVTGGGQSQAREAVGIASSPEVVAELLADVNSIPSTPFLRWERDELRQSLGDDASDNAFSGGVGGMPELSTGIAEFIDSTPKQLDHVVEHLRQVQVDNEDTPLRLQLSDSTYRLNQERPLLPADMDLTPSGSNSIGDHSVIDVGGWINFYDWIEVRSIVSTHGLQWNDFGDHRPESVPRIARSLRSEDLRGNVRTRLSDSGHVHVTRIPGPAGPIHEVTINGLHRTHAFALVGAPLIVAEVTVYSLPIYLSPYSVFKHGEYDEDQERLWRGLVRRGLLHATFHTHTPGSRTVTMCPLWVSAPWMLLSAKDATRVAAAYERAYPGALTTRGIPRGVLGDAASWRRWLLS